MNCSFKARNLPCLVLSVSARSFCLLLPLVHKSCSRSQWRHQFIFSSSLLHLVPVRKQTFLSYTWKTPWLESQLSACTACVISDSSVPHHQYSIFVSTVKSRVNCLHFQKVSHCGEMRSNKPLHWIPNSSQNCVSLPRSLQAFLLWLTKMQQPATLASLWPFTFTFSILLTCSTLW